MGQRHDNLQAGSREDRLMCFVALCTYALCKGTSCSAEAEQGSPSTDSTVPWDEKAAGREPSRAEDLELKHGRDSTALPRRVSGRF